MILINISDINVLLLHTFICTDILIESAVPFFWPCSYFILNKRTGFLVIKENAPPGTYEFQVRVSDGEWPDAVSGVKVHVRELRDEIIYNSASLRLAGTDANFPVLM